MFLIKKKISSNKINTQTYFYIDKRCNYLVNASFHEKKWKKPGTLRGKKRKYNEKALTLNRFSNISWFSGGGMGGIGGWSNTSSYLQLFSQQGPSLSCIWTWCSEYFSSYLLPNLSYIIWRRKGKERKKKRGRETGNGETPLPLTQISWSFAGKSSVPPFKE